MFVAVSGHCLPGCGLSPNAEYLLSRGTVHALAEPFLAEGFAVSAFAATDNFFDEPDALGFLSLVQGLLDIREELVARWDNPTRFIVVAHSHGAVWAHLALFVLEGWGAPLPVDVLVDLDALSLGWEDKAFLGIGDAWAPIIRAHARDTGQMWPFDIANASDSVRIPGLTSPQDIEDVVPDSVLINLEVWSDDGLGVRDSQLNHRLDGSERDLVLFRALENHETTDDPRSQSVTWAARQLRTIYGL